MQNRAENLLTHLRAYQFFELDQILNNTQLDFEEGKITEAQLNQTFSAFCSEDESLCAPLDEFVLRYPSSFAARLAYGIFYIEYGWTKRGYAFASELSEHQVHGFVDCLKLAHESLTVSLGLTRSPLLSYVQLLIIAMGLGEEKIVEQTLYQKALKASPKSLLVRKQYLRNLRPQWGGSLEEMRKFTTRSRHEVLLKSDYVELIASKYYILNHYYMAVDTQIPRSIFEFFRATNILLGAKLLRVIGL